MAGTGLTASPMTYSIGDLDHVVQLFYESTRKLKQAVHCTLVVLLELCGCGAEAPFGEAFENARFKMRPSKVHRTK